MSSDKFAKLFETEKYGQILVKIDSSDDGPEVRFYFQPENLGVCSIAHSFKDSDAGWLAAEKFFHKVDVEVAEENVKYISSNLNE